ncbi:thioesterase family protein [Thalassotalea aquiviva]|uniref:thioesterase family protein n=1 Tax=Thalassotalea aquiviva TaxID=3242415 RepID=UPI00352BB4F1
MDKQQIFAQMLKVWNTDIAFNRHLGLKVTKMEQDHAQIEFDWQANLIGNPITKTLHGGVTAAVLDMAGGVVAAANMLSRLPVTDKTTITKKLARLSTIDFRTDFLRPGRGNHFIATARIIRHGSKIAVTRMELHNEKGEHIAFGTGTYMV